ncbi:MAG: hypothetical protein K2P67_04765 [Gallionellaceae bacterium]|nr:hypothetical protein [Gallionellaceae bacterium]
MSNQHNPESQEIEYIVLASNGTKAPPPHGGPFSSKEEAIRHCALQEKIEQENMSIEDWIAAHPDSIKVEQIEGYGKVLHVAPDGQWIQNRGKNNFAVHPATDLELEIGESVQVDKSGEIKLLDRSHVPGISH